MSEIDNTLECSEYTCHWTGEAASEHNFNLTHLIDSYRWRLVNLDAHARAFTLTFAPGADFPAVLDDVLSLSLTEASATPHPLVDDANIAWWRTHQAAWELAAGETLDLLVTWTHQPLTYFQRARLNASSFAFDWQLLTTIDIPDERLENDDNQKEASESGKTDDNQATQSGQLKDDDQEASNSGQLDNQPVSGGSKQDEPTNQNATSDSQNTNSHTSSDSTAATNSEQSPTDAVSANNDHGSDNSGTNNSSNETTNVVVSNIYSVNNGSNNSADTSTTKPSPASTIQAHATSRARLNDADSAASDKQVNTHTADSDADGASILGEGVSTPAPAESMPTPAVLGTTTTRDFSWWQLMWVGGGGVLILTIIGVVMWWFLLGKKRHSDNDKQTIH